MRKYCGTHSIAHSYTMQIKRYVNREHARNEIQSHMPLLQNLPEAMIRELFQEGRSHTLHGHSFFKEIGRQDLSMELNLCHSATHPKASRTQVAMRCPSSTFWPGTSCSTQPARRMACISWIPVSLRHTGGQDCLSKFHVSHGRSHDRLPRKPHRAECEASASTSTVLHWTRHGRGARHK